MGVSVTDERIATVIDEELVDALLDAARYDDVEELKSLASAGVPLNSKDSFGRTALHMAAANGHLKVVEYLISQGAVGATFALVCCTLYMYRSMDMDASNEEKNTPLHWACVNGHVKVIKKLIDSGACLSALNSHERTPLDEALSQGKNDVIEAIYAAIAQVELAGVSVS